MSSPHAKVALALFLAIGVSSCSAPHAVVKGKVTHEGKEVTAGGLVLAPIADLEQKQPGGPGVADIGPDGAYSMKIEPGADGLAKRFSVRFTPPPTVSSEEGQFAIVPYEGLIPREAEVEIKPGNNTIDVELIPRPK